MSRVLRLTALWFVGLLIVAPAAWAGPGSAPIVFERSGDLFALRLGHGVTELTNTLAREHTPVWSPDHDRVAFAVGKRAVGVLNVATGRRRVIARLPDRIDAIQALAWSPDGNSIEVGAMNLFRRNSRVFRLNGTVWAVGAGGRALRLVAGGQGLVTGLAFTPDGTRVFA